MKDNRLLAGKIINTHSVHGQLKINSLCDSPQLFCSISKFFDINGKEYIPEKMSVHKGFVIAKFKGIDDMTCAEKYKQVDLYINRDDLELEDGTYFIVDLIDVQVIDCKTGENYGKITDVLTTGANDVYVINGNRGQLLVPAIPSVIDNVDIDNKIMKISPLEGLFD